MAYTDQKMSGGKLTAIVIVALIHIALGYAFVTGLAYQYIKKTGENLKVIDIEEPPPPPPDIPPPPPPPDQPNTPPPPPTLVVSPPPVVPPQQPTFQIQTTPDIPKFQPIDPPTQAVEPQPPAKPLPPPVEKPVVSQAASSRGTPQSWFSPEDYPDAAARAQAGGRVSVRVTVGPNGRVSDCTVVSGSGNSALDSATCRVARSRGRYTAAKDQNGNPIGDTATFNVTWRPPEE
jgi:protein TonB